jgi:hypothetical protein
MLLNKATLLTLWSVAASLVPGTISSKIPAESNGLQDLVS